MKDEKKSGQIPESDNGGFPDMDAVENTPSDPAESINLDAAQSPDPDTAQSIDPDAADDTPSNPCTTESPDAAQSMDPDAAEYTDSYSALATGYDSLMPDAEYPARVEYLERVFLGHNSPVKTVLDLGCGTGTVAWMLAARGYRVIAADASPDMLTQAMGKAARFPGFSPPLFILQRMEELDLGPQRADAAVSTIDALNYLTRVRDLRETFRRVRKYLTPGGVFVFDVNTPHKFRLMDGQLYMDEANGHFCVWRTFFTERSGICTYEVDVFRRVHDGLWDRQSEVHRERAWGMEQLRTLLSETGFVRVRCFGDLSDHAPEEDENRWIFIAERE